MSPSDNPSDPVDQPAVVPAEATRPAPEATSKMPWIPIRSISPRQRERILTHLLGLTENDRYYRFGYPASDGQLAKYVDQIDFDRDEVFGVFDRRLRLIATAHLAYAPQGTAHGADAEFGVSVLPHARGRGYGKRLFEHSVLHARNHGVKTMFVHALSENAAMLHIARAAGASVERDGSESEAHLKLPPETLASQVEQFIGDGAAELDYRIKQNALRVDALLDALGDIRAGIAKVRGSASQ
jgi:GNAT superfamily N-acetyltransferase